MILRSEALHETVNLAQTHHPRDITLEGRTEVLGFQRAKLLELPKAANFRKQLSPESIKQ